jgi:hypothetical protein
MADVWVWRTTVVLPEPGSDLTGFEVQASDGERIGTVDEATSELDGRALVVDTGFWIFGKKRMIPVGLVESVDPESRAVLLAATKDDVKDAPDYDEVQRADAAYRDRLARHYSAMLGDPIAPVAGIDHEPPP